MTAKEAINKANDEFMAVAPEGISPDPAWLYAKATLFMLEEIFSILSSCSSDACGKKILTALSSSRNRGAMRNIVRRSI